MAADHNLCGDATAPIARRHPTPALPRLLRAARLDHRRATAARSTPCWARSTSSCWCVERYEPRAVVCCFGQESATYRTELYPPYHAHRPPMPDDLAHQWEQAPALYEALGWTVAATTRSRPTT